LPDTRHTSDPSLKTASSGFLGHAGEHYVLYQLYRRGLLAALSPRGAPTIDVLVLSPDESVVASLQVKTKTRQGGWFMGEKHERFVAPHFFYAFVDLQEPENPLPRSQRDHAHQRPARPDRHLPAPTAEYVAAHVPPALRRSGSLRDVRVWNGEVVGWAWKVRHAPVPVEWAGAPSNDV
jgi:hypothetical protein